MRSGKSHRRSRPRAAACTAIAALALVGAACRDEGSRKNAAPASLAQSLERLPPQEQLARLRVLARDRADDPVVHFHTGNAYYALGAEAEANDPALAVAYFDTAVASYGRAVELDSTYSKAYVNMGLALSGQRKETEAGEAFRRAIEVNPLDVLAHCHLGHHLYTLGDVAGAIKLYLRALAIDPASAQAHYNLGLAFADAKVFREALVHWEKVIELDPHGDLGKTAAENVGLIRTYLETKP